MIIHLGYQSPGISSNLPGGSDGPPSSASLFGLAPGGVYQACKVTFAAGELLPHLFTLTLQYAGRSIFCGTFPGVAPGSCYEPPCPVEPGLSSCTVTVQAIIHPLIGPILNIILNINVITKSTSSMHK